MSSGAANTPIQVGTRSQRLGPPKPSCSRGGHRDAVPLFLSVALHRLGYLMTRRPLLVLTAAPELHLRASQIGRERGSCEYQSPKERILCSLVRQVFRDACNENSQNNYNVCFNNLCVSRLHLARTALMRCRVQYAQTSATNYCSQYYILYNNGLVNHDYSQIACSDARVRYVYCSNYT